MFAFEHAYVLRRLSGIEGVKEVPLVNLPAGTPLLVTSELYTARSQLPVTMGTYDLKSTLELHYASPTAARAEASSSITPRDGSEFSFRALAGDGGFSSTVLPTLYSVFDKVGGLHWQTRL